MARNPDLTCAGCAKPLWSGKGSLPQGQATCHACRREKRRCLDCGQRCGGTRCMKCHARHRTIRAADDSYLVRKQRESAAPGLGYAAQKRLLAKWKRQGRRCAYCERMADTIDHAVPLVRGGTNYEGNLVPACRRCNSSKAGWFITEWRTGKRLPSMARPVTWKQQPRQRVAKPQPIKSTRGEQRELFRVCVCGAAYLGAAAYCSTRCAMRSHYRIKAGIPLDAPTPRDVEQISSLAHKRMARKGKGVAA